MWLGIDTSGSHTSLALVSKAFETLAESEEKTSRHAETLLPAIDAILRRNSVSLRDLCGIAVGRGPGSFAGLRAGLATAHALSRALDIPMRSVPSSYARAWQHRSRNGGADPARWAVLTPSHGALFFLCSLRATPHGLTYESSHLVRDANTPWHEFDAICAADPAQLENVPVTCHARVYTVEPSAASCAKACEDFLRLHENSGHEPVYARGPID